MVSDRTLLNQTSLGWLLLIALVVLGAGLGLRDPWPADEPRFALIAREMVESGQWLFPMRGGELYPDKPPLFMWGIAIGYVLTGSIKVAFLLPSLLSGLLTILLVWDLGRRLWNPAVGFMAGLLLLFTVQFTLQAKTAQIDALATAFITLGLYGFLRFLLCEGGWRWYWLGWFAAGLGVITKGVGVLALLVLLPALWTHRAQIRAAPLSAWLKALLGPLAMALAMSLWLVPMLEAVTRSGDPLLLAYRDNILLRQTVTRYTSAWHHVKPFWYYLTSVIPPFWLPLSLLLPWLVLAWRKAIQGQDKRVILLLGYLVLVVLFFSLSPGKRGVYVTPGTPALALLTAPYMGALLARVWPGRLLGCSTAVSMAFTDRASSLSPHQLPPPMAQVPSPRNGAERPLLPMLRFSIDRYLLFRQRPAKGGVVADWYILLYFRFIPKRAAAQVFCTAALGNL